MRRKMHISLLSRFKFYHTITWAVLLCALIIALAATLARAAINLKGALTIPDLAVHFLVEDAVDSTFLRAHEGKRDYLVEMKNGDKKWVQLEKGETKWYISDMEDLRE